MNRISTRLAVSFLIVALLPTLPLSLVVRNLLERRFGPTIADPLEQALDAGLAESRAHLAELRRNLANRAGEAAETAAGEPIVLLTGAGKVQPADSLVAYLEARPELLSRAEGLAAGSPGDEAAVRRIGDTLIIAVSTAGVESRVLQPLPAGMVARAGQLTEGVSLLRLVRGQESQVLRSLVGPFLVVYVTLIVVALVIGMLWSRRMVKPLEVLVAATRRVAAGDLAFTIEKQGPGEVGELVHSFDTMVGHLEEQRRDLARLERAAAWRGMARTLAHEVKNPLTPILLAVNQARDSYRGDDDEYRALLTEVAEIVGEEVESLRRLVRTFGDFARLPRPEPRPGDLADLLRDLQQLYGDEKLRLSGLLGLAPGWFDADALRRALVNLIDNGLASCRQAGAPAVVDLHAEALPGGGVRLTISDDGTGIDPEDLTRIFEPDFTTKRDGMGLGLAIVENIIMGHGGRIRVESEPGHGARFTVELPLTAPPDESIPNEEV